MLYNFTGASDNISTHVGNVIYGPLLALKYDFNLDGAFIGEIIGGGKTIVLLSGANVDAGSQINNTAMVSANSDSNAGNNSSSATITLP